jgi:hypothetical protein
MPMMPAHPSRRFWLPFRRDRECGSISWSERRILSVSGAHIRHRRPVASLPKNRAIMLTPREREPRMIAKLLLQNVIWIAAMGALLLLPAGTLHWPGAWVFLATIAILGISGGL